MPLSNPEFKISSQSQAGPIPPGNPNIGDRWLEFKNQIFIEDWLWDGNFWVTSARSLDIYIEGTGTKFYNIPLSPSYNYQILSWRIWLFSSIAMTATNYLSCSLKMVQDLAETEIFKFPQPTIAASTNEILFNSNPISIITTTNDKRSLQLTLSRFGTVNYRAASLLTYQIIRK